jgi:hypothetical protein
MEDAQSASFMGMENGFGFLRTLGHYVRGLGKAKLEPEEAAKMLVHLENLDVHMEGEVFNQLQSKTALNIARAAEKVDKFTFTVNGMSYITDRGLYTYNSLFLEELANLENRPKFREKLMDYGLREKDFKLLDSLPRDSDGYIIFTDGFKKTRTYRKTLTALYTDRRKAIAATSQSFRAVMSSAGGSFGVGLGIVNSIFFLKRIPAQAFIDHALIPLMRGQYGKVAMFYGQSLIFTATRLTLKYLAMGYTPDFEDWNFYREVMLQTPLSPPILKDVLSMRSINTMDFYLNVGKLALGAYSPFVDVTAHTVKTMTGDEAPGMLVTNALKQFAPLRTHPALNALYERLIFDNLLLAFDPEAHTKLARREEFRATKGFTRF